VGCHSGDLGVERKGVSLSQLRSPSLSFCLPSSQKKSFHEEGGQNLEKSKLWNSLSISLWCVCVCVCVCVFVYVCVLQRGETALHMAARAGQSNVVRYLIQNGARVDAKAKVEPA